MSPSPRCSPPSPRSGRRSSSASPRSATWAMCTAPGWRWTACWPATTGPSSRSAQRSPTEAFRCELLHQGSRVRITMVQLPAVNTPQFDWVLNRLPNHPRPVAPVYQPELAAKAVVYAADHPGRREYWVGGSTVGTLVANKLVPGLLDRYLTRTAYEAQQTDQPADPGRPVNLWEPVDGPGGRDFGAHGAFDDEAANRSLQAWVGRRPGLAAATGGLLAGLVALRLKIGRAHV